MQEPPAGGVIPRLKGEESQTKSMLEKKNHSPCPRRRVNGAPRSKNERKSGHKKKQAKKVYYVDFLFWEFNRKRHKQAQTDELEKTNERTKTHRPSKSLAFCKGMHRRAKIPEYYPVNSSREGGLGLGGGRTAKGTHQGKEERLCAASVILQLAKQTKKGQPGKRLYLGRNRKKDGRGPICTL